MEWIILLLIKDTRGDKNEIVVVRVFADPQEENISGWSCSMRTQGARGIFPKTRS